MNTEQTQPFCELFCFCKDIWWKRSQRLHGHCVSEVNDYAEIVSAVVNDYADPWEIISLCKNKKIKKKVAQM